MLFMSLNVLRGLPKIVSINSWHFCSYTTINKSLQHLLLILLMMCLRVWGRSGPPHLLSAADFQKKKKKKKIKRSIWTLDFTSNCLIWDTWSGICRCGSSTARLTLFKAVWGQNISEHLTTKCRWCVKQHVPNWTADPRHVEKIKT